MRLSLPKPQTLLLHFKSNLSSPSPSPNPKWPFLPGPISTPIQLGQLLALATVSGLLHGSFLHLWNALLHSVARGPSPELAISLFDLIRTAGVGPDNYTFTSVLKAVAVAGLSFRRRGEELHSLSLKLGFASDTFVQNSLIHMYSACGSVRAARRVFDLAPDSVRDVVSWNSMMSGYLQSNLCEEALWVFRKMVKEAVEMDPITPVSALIACARIGALDLGRAIHAVIVVNGFELSFYLGSSLVSMYAKSGAVDDARKLFDGMPERNVVCWTSMISGYAQSGRYKESIELFRQMQVAGVRADDATILSVVSSCAQLGAFDHGQYIHAYCDLHGIGKDISVKNALIDMYLKCGNIERALQIFQGMIQQDVFSWTTMISGLAMNGNSNEALDLFSRMEESGEVMPNEVTFLAVLSACSHGGFIEKGYHYFDRMSRVYNITPKIEHYGCMVDLLGRARLLVEAVKFINEMPIEPDVVIWRSLLFACCNYGDVRLAEYAAQRAIEFEPKKHGGHVLLSNVYAKASRWSDVHRVRRVMNDWSVQKQPGCSFIEINGIVHEFLAADISHHQAEVIHEVLWGINRHVVEESCTAPTSHLLCGSMEGKLTERKHKDKHLP